MADEKEKDAAPKRGGKKMILAIVLLVGAVAGGGAGAVFAGPLLAEMILGPAGAPVAEARTSGEGEHGESDGHGAVGAATYLVDNLVLNPAGSNGTRFLMATVAFDLEQAEAAAQMGARDAQVRDALLSVLGHKTVEQLTDITARDSLKSELKDAVSGFFPEGTIRAIYLPQFVIQ
ncbi:MAG TPA: flagellar basal body-associated FliL family protein [Longimicrobiaceae bacterium]